MLPSATSTAAPGRRRVASMHTATSTAPTPTTNASTRAPPWRPKWNGPARYVASRNASSHSATNASRPTAHRAAQPHPAVEHDGGDRRARARRTITHAHRRPDLAVAEEAVLVGVDEERRVRSASDPPASPVSIRRPSIASGRSSPKRCRMVGRDVDDVDEAVALRRGRAQQPRREARARARRRRERVAVLRRRRSHDDDRVALGSTSASSRPTSGRCRRARGRASSPPARRTRTAPEVGPHEIGPLHQHDRPAVHASRKARSTWSGSSRTPNGAAASAAGGRGRPVRPAPCPRSSSARRPRRAGTAAPRLGRARVGAVAVGDHGAVDARRRPARRRAPRPRRRRARRRSPR